MQEGLRFVRVELGRNANLLIRFISKWGKMDIQVSGIEDLLSEIERLNPDAVEVDMSLHDRIGGIDTVNLIRDRLDVNAWFE